jgi:hypothetical protein
VLGPRFEAERFWNEPIGCADLKADIKSEGPFSSGELAEAKKAAFRRGIWFRALNRVERAVIDLTIRYVDNVKSTKLAKMLTAIMEKLQQATESMADRFVRIVGVPLAQKASGIAVSWGNRSASTWANDRGFSWYLAFTSTKTKFVTSGLRG